MALGRMRLRAAAMTALVVLGCVAPRAADAADDECGSGSAMGSTATGTMDSNDINDWWSHTTSQHRRVTLTASGDLDLQVRAADCQTVLCFSQGPSSTEACSITTTGTVWFAVVHWPPGSTTISYTLSVAEGPACQNGADDDADGAIDYPSDTGCSSSADTTEAPNPQCSDGADNDADGAVDYPADPSCASSRDASEVPACDDGVDNDGDGRIDYPADPGCTQAVDEAESPDPQCGDGIDNDGDGYADYPDDPGCSSERDDQEGAECAPVAGIVACITSGAEVLRVDAVEPGNAQPVDVAGYVDVYRFTAPGGASTSLPCVVLGVGATTANPCALAGGSFVSRMLALVETEVPAPVSDGVVAGGIAVCAAELTLLVGDIGINSAPAFALC